MSDGEIEKPEPSGGRPEPGDSPPTSRRLERPPSERYRLPAAPGAIASTTSGRPGVARRPVSGSPARATWGGVAAGLAGTILFILAAGGLSFDWGLIVIAVYIGWSVAIGVSLGGGWSLSPAFRRRLAVGLALVALTVAEVGVWAWARSQGGDLPIIEHLWTTYGLLLPVQYVAAIAAAAWSTR